MAEKSFNWQQKGWPKAFAFGAGREGARQSGRDGARPRFQPRRTRRTRIFQTGFGVRLEYRLNFTVEPSNEGIKKSETLKNKGKAGVSREPPFNDEGINEGINEWLVKIVRTHPGSRLPYLKSEVGKSRATVERAIAALVKAGRVEHRGSKKTGGYYPL